MTAIVKAASQLVGSILLPPKVDTATTGTAVDVTQFEGLGLVTLSTGAAGSSGIMKVLVEDSADNSSFAAVTSFGTLGTGYTANTAGSNQLLTYPVDLDLCRQYVRASSVLVSGVNLILGVQLHAVKKVSA
jgi:hypothetical protein